jgi:hypothetical protein
MNKQLSIYPQCEEEFFIRKGARPGAFGDVNLNVKNTELYPIRSLGSALSYQYQALSL